MTEKVEVGTLTLTVKDRFIIPELLPERSNLTDQYLAQDILDKIKLSREEREQVGLAFGEGTIAWKDGAQADKTVTFSKAEIDLLDRYIKNKSNEQQVHRDMLETIKKIQALVQA